MSFYLRQMGLTAHGLVLAASKTTTKSSSATPILLLLGFALVFYLLVLRPRSQRMRQAQQQQRNAAVGDEVMLTSGIIGRVTSIDGDRATVEVAPEIEIEVVRRAIGQVLNRAEDEEQSLYVPPDPAIAAADQSGEGGDEEEGADPVAYDEDSTGEAAASPATAGEAEVPEEGAGPGPLASERLAPGPGAALDLGGDGKRS